MKKYEIIVSNIMSIKAVPTYLLGLKPLARDVHPYRFENVIGILQYLYVHISVFCT